MKQGKVVDRSCFLSLHTPPKGHVLFDLADLLRDLMAHLSHHYYNYGSSEFSVYHRRRTIRRMKEVKGQREAIVMEVRSLLPGNESDVHVCSVK